MAGSITPEDGLAGVIEEAFSRGLEVGLSWPGDVGAERIASMNALRYRRLG